VRCLCACCLLEAVLRLLRSGRVGMATALLEQALRLERERPVPPAAPRACQAEAGA
jgi:hypothetical protein